MNTILTIEELKARAPKLSVGQVNQTLRSMGVKIGRGDGEWNYDFCRDHAAFIGGLEGTRGYCATKTEAVDGALENVVWYRRHVAKKAG